MADQTYPPGSPEWWLQRLCIELRDRREGRRGSRRWNRKLLNPSRVRPGLDRLHDYLVGDPPLHGYAEAWGDTFRAMSRIGRLNMCPLIIGAKSSRMTLRGFKTAAANDEVGDKEASQVMRQAKIKTVARETHDFQLWGGTGYVMVPPPATPGGIPTVTAEDPRQTITCHDPATGITLAGLKMYRDEWDLSYVAHLYIRDPATGDYLHFPLRNEGKAALRYTGANFADGWDLTDDVMALDRMPIIRFPNRNGGIGEYEWHLDTIDRINDQIMDKVVIAKVQAFRQMAVKGLPDKTIQIVDGKPVEVPIDYSNAFEATPGSLWQLPAGADMWESTPTDLGPLRLSIKDDLQYLAAATQTSLPAITPDATQGSAEGATLMREEEVFAVEACQDYAAGGWAEAMSTLFHFMGDDQRADPTQIQAMWGPVERFSLSDKANADHLAGSLPDAAKWIDVWQYDPEDVARLRQMQGQDLLLQPAAAAPSNGVPPVTFLPPRQQGQQQGQPSGDQQQ